MTNDAFLELLWRHYDGHGRHDLPWRQPAADGGFDPYSILVSELMLQQTQVTRVIPKFTAFMAEFPTPQVLAASELGAVLTAWSGLGYNRRAKFLHQAAQQVTSAGSFPDDLTSLPGVGVNTAGAIAAYAYNRPVLFVETNIRSVYIHHFFPGQGAVPDSAILECLQATLDHEQPREFYWALMDYGSHLKATVGNASRSSKHYTRQSAFAGSRRQVRGQVLKLLTTGPQSMADLARSITDERLVSVLDDLLQETLIHLDNRMYRL